MKLGRFNEADELLEKGKDVDELPEIHCAERDWEMEGTRFHSEDLLEMFKKLFPSTANDKKADSKLMDSYIDMLDTNTPDAPNDASWCDGDIEYSDEELQDIWDNDPGYLNINAVRKFEGEEDPSGKRTVIDPEGGYMEVGFHRGGLENYGPEYVEGTQKIATLQPGKILERWGDENGSYFTEPGTVFADLHLNVSEDKRQKHQYLVTKEFDVMQSEIADQPYDEQGNSKASERAIQYKASITVAELSESECIQKIESNDFSQSDNINRRR